VRHRTNLSADHGVMRELNRVLVLDLLKKESPLSRTSIAKATELAKPTVSAIVDDLMKEGVIREVGPGASSPEGGRPPILLEFDAHSQFVVGVHLGVRQTTMVLADAKGIEIDRIQKPTSRSKPVTAVPKLAQLIETLFASTGLPKSWLAAVGVCVPGLVELSTGVVMLAPNLGWKNVPLKESLSQILEVPVFIHNTSQASAVAESIEGAGNGTGNLIFLYVGTGVGAGVLTEGHVYHGGAGIAGEIGHCRVPGIEARCNCGLTGCLETVASAPAVARAASEWLEPTDGEELTAVDVADAARSGDERAIEVFRSAGAALGTATAWLINLFNPQVVVVGGGMVGAGEFLLKPLEEAALAEALPQASRRVDIRPSQLGQEAEVRGAVLLALQYSETNYRLMFQT
jgi:N-acetylglucosamine repressor